MLTRPPAGPVVLAHDLPDPFQSDRGLDVVDLPGVEFLDRLLAGEFRVPLQYPAEADASARPAIHTPAHNVLYRISRRGGQANCLEHDLGSFAAQGMLESGMRDHLFRGAVRMLAPEGLDPCPYHVVLEIPRRMMEHPRRRTILCICWPRQR